MAKVWLITCRCKALVRALTEAVLASGENVVTTAVDAATVADLAERYGDQLRMVPVDVTSARAAGSAIEAALDAFGRLDVACARPGEVAQRRRAKSTRANRGVNERGRPGEHGTAVGACDLTGQVEARETFFRVLPLPLTRSGHAEARKWAMCNTLLGVREQSLRQCDVELRHGGDGK